jgi:hypothetical protein
MYFLKTMFTLIPDETSCKEIMYALDNRDVVPIFSEDPFELTVEQKKFPKFKIPI